MGNLFRGKARSPLLDETYFKQFRVLEANENYGKNLQVYKIELSINFVIITTYLRIYNHLSMT